MSNQVITGGLLLVEHRTLGVWLEALRAELVSVGVGCVKIMLLCQMVKWVAVNLLATQRRLARLKRFEAMRLVK